MSRAYFEEQGFFIYRKLIPGALIDSLLSGFRGRIKPSREYFFRQSGNQWEKNSFSEHGHVRNSFLDVHDDAAHAEFSDLARRIFCLPAVRAALTDLTGEPEHSLMQSMLFDFNSATPAHQDYYYLDSVPNGRLLAGWFALEDIHEQAGRFFVMPGTHRVTFELTEDEKVSNTVYLRKIGDYVAKHAADVQAPALARGDVLFWHSKTIHGSLPTRDGRYSRKSLTAHYMPSELQFGNMTGYVQAVRYAEFEGMPYRINEKRCSLGSLAKYRFKNYLDRRPGMRRLINAVKRPLGL